MRPPILAFVFLFLVCCAPSPPSAAPPLPKDTLPSDLDLSTIPRGLAERPKAPADNPLTKEKVALGRRLFFEPRLSKDGTVACATCHDPAHGFASGSPRAVGIRGQVGRRNAPSLQNRAFGRVQFWDGRVSTLEEQALKPIEDPLEMDHSVAAAVAFLKKDESYSTQFAKAFPDGVSPANIGKAIAAFERTLLHGDSVYDAFIANDVAQMSPAAKYGLWLFESKSQCWRCHNGTNFSDEQFHNTGISWGKEPLDLGRYEITKKAGDEGKFKTPTLRGLVHTAPYMHDGSMATLEEVVRYYNKGGNPNPQLDPALRPLELGEEEVQALVAFLKALSEPAKP